MSFPFPCLIAQLNPTVGDIDGNVTRILHAYDEAIAQDTALIIFSECVITGYPAEDLILLPAFQQAAQAALARIRDYTRGKNTAILLGNIISDGGDIYNAACLIDNGELTIRYKCRLPNMGVFDEERVFSAGPLPNVIEFRGTKLGVMVCEDMWNNHVAEHLAGQGADYFVVLNASPYEYGKHRTRTQLAKMLCISCDAPLLYINQTGGQDELVFDGRSFVMNESGIITMQAPAFTSGCYNSTNILEPIDYPQFTLRYHAMLTGLHDYVRKNGFSQVLIGLSGGIDSALTAVVAVDALGADAVHCVMLPSPYTSQISLDDAAELASILDVTYDIVPIKAMMEASHHTLENADQPPSALAAENLQSRIRGLLLMSISNSSGALLLTTGNKSEMAMGYATLYGDMCGAYSVLKDVYKSDIFALARWRNLCKGEEIDGLQKLAMPERIITRPPSAELRDNQKDKDSLPPYDVLDTILKLFIEERRSSKEIIADGYDEGLVKHIATLLQRAEYKRRQAPPGVKLTSMAFGRDWRMPLTNNFKL